MVCPACHGRTFRPAIPAGEIARQVRIRERLLSGAADPLPDRVRFVQDDIVDLLCCRRCHTLRRDVPAGDAVERYAADRHVPEDMQRLFDAYVEEYRCREPQYRGLLAAGAPVLEVGSYVGAFLHVAREWGWHATGVDVNREVAEFAGSRGLATRSLPLEACAFRNAAFDAVFVWNCFEQAPDPAALLREIARVLRAGGLLVIRTPNAVYYRLHAALLAASRRTGVRAPGRAAARALDHHNLLGFPFLYGFGRRALHQLLSRNGFERAGARPRGLPAWLEVSYRKQPLS